MTTLSASMDRLQRDEFVRRLWERDASLWSQDPSVQAAVRDRLGWLDAPEWTQGRLNEIRGFAASIRDNNFRRVILLGMGGSSLAPEVLHRILGSHDGWPAFTMLDSTDPAAVRAVDRDLDGSVFIVASKSGSTIEPNALAAYFRKRMEAIGIPASDRLIVITDPNTSLHERAVAGRFRRIFLNPTDIGGRFSALSLFGMVPAAMMGHDIDAVVSNSIEMSLACRSEDIEENPGVRLGALMAAGASEGRDKLSLHLPATLEAFGLWVEQLVAESTGKNGKGIVPIVNEPLARPAQPADRLHVSVELPTPAAIGGEFMRWEVATAAAGALLGVNPFDEPNVRQAKEATGTLLAAYKSTRQLPAHPPDLRDSVATLTLSEAAREALGGSDAWHILNLLRPGDYLALLIYLAPAPSIDEIGRRARVEVATKTGCAAMVGYGPRYLHSTGQLHKGGPNTGVFIVVTADPEVDIDVPDEGFTFGALEQAQALGDFMALEQAGRRVLHVHLPAATADALGVLLDRLLEGLGRGTKL